MRKKLLYLLLLLALSQKQTFAQVKSANGNILAATPPMGWMTWNYFADQIHEKEIMEMADALVKTGMRDAGYHYIFIDDGWQGGRDNRNNIIADPKKFPSGIKALSDYVHSKGLKLGIYSDAAPLTCAGYTASLGFEEQDAKIFASWGIDYLKYDYCGAPSDAETAKHRYKTMADALRKSGREIAFGICEWGDRKPWLWAAEAGGQLWRTTGDVRDKWKRRSEKEGGEGILDIIDVNAGLDRYAGIGHWNDMDMLVVGLNGKKGPSGDLGGTGCTIAEYQSQMSLWCILASPLAATNDLRTMDEQTKRILLNAEVIQLNQDPLGKQAALKVNDAVWTILVKPLSNGDYAVAVLNRSDAVQTADLKFADLGLNETYTVRDLWAHKTVAKGKKWKGQINSHETKVFRLKNTKS
ncbi:alpha-galactosidase [Pedobacter sp. HMWF019]|uniref:glycoside hydrolase family 27 protein n=1 Tax=Pedobacter sp. HMWF019 TaxID=2056856 RepID=UPI000D3C51BA|nr:glycoside hydrolase family 27 protein [Pedobacter sp. HMWF019]PTS97955.1 alpha-galactosidase [Pedobacter sp. HMWF019]